ncbi:hypothetical protein HYFRA_00012103 [Hymenoscyphus fraxineus]|uniref:DNA ligase n=1 Tax=Hymenoscyphus fraxineus TaxID=746836 RepID=A0A9N9KYA6_9HELO|nr:hypothetical protein HYFRA_00012103 [Hymenoscyphus fraxineus]
MPSQRLPSAAAEKEDQSQYHNGPVSKEELDAKYPNRPHNHSRTFFFGDLITELFNPLNENINKKNVGPKINRRKLGPHHNSTSPVEIRRQIIERFISRWRKEVGDDFYPALRLIIPDRDRDRPTYGLKEKAIAKLLIKLLKINKDSDDGFNILNWKSPARDSDAGGSGNFSERCYKVLKKRAIINEPGDLRIAEVNEMLDQLAAAQKEENQLPIFERFYHRMNAEELTWLIRIIIRGPGGMKIGATEKTILDLWHPDGESLFNVSSSLRRVCWELIDPDKRLGGEETGIELMECFQPQLAQFQNNEDNSFQKMITKMRMPVDNPQFWIEEKLDGERMQLHMREDASHPGGRRFGFWSRKAKNYTYLYGNGFEDDDSALTRHLKDAFDNRVKNIILDGEMITWDPETDKMVPFGTLKTAALSEKKNPFQIAGIRPLFRVFDCVFLNNKVLTEYTLRDRRRALEGAVRNVHRRMEIHTYTIGEKAEDITPALHQIVTDASEGLVLKNPASTYQLNARNDNWMKVKPEYMDEYGEMLDCVVIGGYYGSGRRGGALSSFMCGLRVDQNHIAAGANPMKCYSFFKVGGGFGASDYATIRHQTEGKWKDWDVKNPPTEFVELAGGDRQRERPDVWIRPCDSIVIQVKASSVDASESFMTRYTLRFPRFQKIRHDKDWKSALSLSEFAVLKSKVEEETKKKGDFKVDSKRKSKKRVKKDLIIAGADSKIKTPYAGPQTQVFAGLDFCVLTDMTKPVKKSKAELEQMIKTNGGTITQNPYAKENILIIADKRTVKPASIIKRGTTNLISGAWIVDVLKQAEIDGPGRKRYLLPFEPRHLFHVLEEKLDVERNVDVFGDSYARDILPTELGILCEGMIYPKTGDFDPALFRMQLEERGRGISDLPGEFLGRCKLFFLNGGIEDVDRLIMISRVRFAGATVAEDEHEEGITHFIAQEGDEGVRTVRERMVVEGRIARVVSGLWVEDCWREGTRLDEERYVV